MLEPFSAITWNLTAMSRYGEKFEKWYSVEGSSSSYLGDLVYGGLNSSREAEMSTFPRRTSLGRLFVAFPNQYPSISVVNHPRGLFVFYDGHDP